MSREIKFQFIYAGLKYRANSAESDRNWFKKVYTLDQLIEKPLSKLADIHDCSELIAKRQFTGLTDCNGVDIYEGDLIRNESGRIAKVVWFAPSGQWDASLVKSVRGDVSHGMSNNMWKYCVEVIGNIFENKDLLKGLNDG